MLYEITMSFVKDTFTTALDAVRGADDKEATRSFIAGARRTRGGELILLSDYLPGIMSAKELNKVLEEAGILKAYYGKDVVCGKCFDPVTRMTQTVTKRGKKVYRPALAFTQYFKRTTSNLYALKTATLTEFEDEYLDGLVKEYLDGRA